LLIAENALVGEGVLGAAVTLPSCWPRFLFLEDESDDWEEKLESLSLRVGGGSIAIVGTGRSASTGEGGTDIIIVF
jgi:hypothetical protein